ncbi:MAG: NAD(P)/FAD-dependent oxidoreductase [Sulfobacillus thermotolerans]|nr:NAD(P)/FAD-dependent oxidoreductase [Sulfobacillus thermotolerans]
MDTTKFDVVTIGAGPGATPAALYLARHSKRVAVIEQGHALGGTCLLEGCIPSKIYLETAKRIRDIQEAARFGLANAQFQELALSVLTERKQKILRQRSLEMQQRLTQLGVTVVYGRADFLDAHHVVVQTGDARKILSAEYIIASPGSRPKPLRVPEADDASLWTNAQALKLDTIPSSLCIVGGGYIGAELATLYQALGTRVHVLEAASRILASEDPAIGAYLTKNWSSAINPIEVETDVRVTRIETRPDGRWTVGYNHPLRGFRRKTVDRVLVAIGREPNTGQMAWDKVGITLGPRGEVPVNRYFQTTVPHIYAPGDVNGQIMLAHAAARQSSIVAQHILKKPTAAAHDIVPHVIMSSPEIAAVGADTRSLVMHPTWRVTQWQYQHSVRPLVAGDERGFAQLIWDRATHKIMGCQIIGLGASELISEMTQVMTHQGTLESFVEAVHPHPTLHEVVTDLAMKALIEAQSETAQEGGAIRTD